MDTTIRDLGEVPLGGKEPPVWKVLGLWLSAVDSDAETTTFFLCGRLGAADFALASFVRGVVASGTEVLALQTHREGSVAVLAVRFNEAPLLFVAGDKDKTIK